MLCVLYIMYDFYENKFRGGDTPSQGHGILKPL